MTRNHLEDRTRTLYEHTRSGACVLYVMSRDQRVTDNHALLAAQQYALVRKLPLLVAFILQKRTGFRSREHYQFMLGGLDEVERTLQSFNIPFIYRIGSPEKEVLQLIEAYTVEAVYFDSNPLRGPKNMQKRVAKKAPCLVRVVDTHNIIPIWHASDKEEFAAHTFRPKIHTLLGYYLVEPEQLQNHPYSFARHMPTQLSLLVDMKKLVAKLPASGIVHQYKPGEKAARGLLHDFMEHRLAKYAIERNNPVVDGQSGLSVYLHFGQLSSLRVALSLREILLAKDSDIHLLEMPTMPKGESGIKASVDALLEELIVRKELADNFCYYNDSYDSLSGAHEWAQASLAQHIQDKREHLYDYQSLRDGLTHDSAWNAAQVQLRQTGKMHGYMRMYWAKKVLEWSSTPQQALDILIQLNDTYSLDGGDPNGYTGIMWSVCGVHDRPWKERPIYGKIRYMNYQGLKRKFDIETYEKRWPNNATLEV